jgi:hypothetical protein
VLADALATEPGKDDAEAVETYIKVEDAWYIKTLHLIRTRVEALPAA